MKNKIVILLAFLVPIAVFAILQYSTKASSANAKVQKDYSNKGRLIKFYSPMCSECKEVGKKVSNVIGEYDGYVVFEEINVSNNDKKTKDLIETYKVTVVPTVVYLDKNGDIVEKTEGDVEEIEIRNNLEKIK